VLSNPAADIDLPKLEKRLPRDILTISEVEQVLSVPDVTTPLGLRDRAILETLYSTGMRRGELLGLRLTDLNPETGVIMIRLGKGKKDRVLPIGERALAWLRKYITDARPQLVVEPDDGAIFLAYNGTPLIDGSLGEVVRNLILDSKVGKRGSCHLFRHTMATHMLEGGADIRFIQQMLGHAQLTTTEIYTQVSIRKLREILATHPGARLKRRAGTESPEGDETEEAREELFSTLAVEEEEEETNSPKR
jgi:integrase/recombinase XerD